MVLHFTQLDTFLLGRKFFFSSASDSIPVRDNVPDDLYFLLVSIGSKMSVKVITNDCLKDHRLMVSTIMGLFYVGRGKSGFFNLYA